MTEKQINKWLRRQFSPVGWVLLGFNALMNLLVWVTVAADLGRQALWNLATGGFLIDFDWEAVWNNGWGYIGANLVLLAVLYAWKGNVFRRPDTAGERKKMKFLPLFAVISFSMGAQLLNNLWIMLLELIAGLLGGSMMPLLESVSGATDSFSMFLYGALVAPVAEELLFRGFVLNALRPYGKRFAILGSAVLFGAFHGNLLQAPYAFVMGLVLGYLAVEYSVLWAVVLHMFNNLVLAEGFAWLAEVLPTQMADWIILALLTVFSLAALVILIGKRSQIRAYRREGWIDRRCVKCFFTSPGIVFLLLYMLASMISFF